MEETVEINEFRVETLRPGQFMDISVSYTAKKNGRVIKRFEFKDTPVRFTEALLDDVKKDAGAYTVNKRDVMKDKIAAIIIRLVQETRDLAKIKEHAEFMKAFNKINCYKIRFPEIEK
jgi:hypothetical protein